jgi:hypothetical protein
VHPDIENITAASISNHHRALSMTFLRQQITTE